MTSTSNVTISVSPSPGFCIKSKLLQPGILNAISTRESTQRPVPIPQGLKIFVNIAWSKDLPPPLDGVEKAFEFVAHSRRTDSKGEGDCPISIFASDGRLDADKEGKAALVFDCIYSSSLKHHALKDVGFKNFLIELALQRVEAENSISLSRTLGTPNISSKGVLEQRVVSVPATLFQPGHHYTPSISKPLPKKLIEEVSSSPAEVNDPSSRGRVRPKDVHSDSTFDTPTWTWKQEGDEVRITIQVPKLTYRTISSATLDLEPGRITLLIPEFYALDIDLDIEFSDSASGFWQARNLDVDGARAEWHVKEGCLVIVSTAMQRPSIEYI